MNKLIFFVLLLCEACIAQAACTDAQNKAEIDPDIKIVHGNVYVGPNHSGIDTITLKVPAIIEGLNLLSMNVNDGGILNVPKYKFPLAYDLTQEFSIAKLEVDLSSIGKFNVSFNYKSNKCNKSFFKLING
jgi:hypothetical protein